MLQTRASLDDHPLDGVTWLTVFAFFLFAIPTRFVFAPLGSAGAPSMVFGILSLIFWTGTQLSRREPSAVFVNPARVALWIFAACVVTSFIAAMSRPIDADEVSPANVALLTCASWSGTFLIAHDGIPTGQRFSVLIWRLAIFGSLLACLGIAQFVFGETIVDRISIPGLASGTADTFSRQGFTRPSGTATHPIEFGVLLTMLLPFALHSAIHRHGRGLVWSWVPPLAIISVMPLSLSRSALLGTIVCLVVLLPAWPRVYRRFAYVAVFLLLVGLPLAVPGLSGSILALFTGADSDPSVQSRTNSYDLAWDFIRNSPWFGRGLGTFLPKDWILDNQYLNTLICNGFVGLLALIGLITTCIFIMVRVRVQVDDPEVRDLAQALIASILAGAVGLALFDGFGFPMTASTLFLVLGLAGGFARLHRRPEKREPFLIPQSPRQLS